MNRYFRENVMDSSAGQEGSQQGSLKQTQNGMQTVTAPSVNTTGQIGENEPKPQLPFEINVIIPEISDIFVKITEIRNKFEAGKENPSLSPAQKVALKRAVDKFDAINKALLTVPNYLSSFVVEKSRK